MIIKNKISIPNETDIKTEKAANDYTQKEGEPVAEHQCEQKEAISKLFTEIGNVRADQAKKDGQIEQFVAQMTTFVGNYREDIRDIKDDISKLSTAITQMIARSEVTINKDVNGVNVTMAPKKSFWDTDAGKAVPKWVAVGVISTVFIITASLLGTNWIEFMQKNQELLKTIKP